MEYRYFGNTDLKTSALGFGTAELNLEYGAIDDDEVVQAIYRGLDLGVTCIDCAPVYGLGRAEEIVGKALGPRRKDVMLLTQCGIRWAEGVRRIWDGSRDSILREIDESLTRLQTDYVDLYLVYFPPSRLGTPLEETIGTLEEIRQSGKARYIGVSNYGLDDLRASVDLAPITANQVVYNLFDRRNEEDIAFARENGVGVMTHGSLSSGLLAGAFTVDTVFADNDWRRSGNVRCLPLMKGENFGKNLEVVEKLKEVARSLGKTQPQLAINWVLSNPGVTVALTGCRNVKEIEDNVGATGWTLSAEDKARIEEIMQEAVGTRTQSRWP
jgi:aryl-alcohol dehydrogenase-like predicted oxidoreductase